MTYKDFKTVLLEKSSQRTVLPSDPLLQERIFVGMKKIAMDTLPLILVENSLSSAQTIRRIDDSTFVRLPIKPTVDEDYIDMDDMLLDALSYYVMAGLEKTKSNVFMGMYWGEIDMNNTRLIENTLSESTNIGDEKFGQFP